MKYIKYNRMFVMLEAQRDDFAVGEDPVEGYLKVETGNNKGAMRCVVQNLKPFSNGEYIYKLIFFGNKKGRMIHVILGGLVINRNGNGETYFRFNPLNFDGKGSSFDDFSVAVVAAASGKNPKESLHPILKGKMEEEETRQMKHESSVISVDAEMGEADASIENITKDKKHEIAKEESKKAPNFNGFYNEYLLQFCDYTCKVAGYYEDVKPFVNDKTGAMWKKIVNVSSLPLVSPGAHFFATHYKHYLFGAKAGENGRAVRYYFAIPGRESVEEQPDGGRSGFTLWQPMTGSGDMKNPYGYWILSVDAASGNIEEA